MLDRVAQTSPKLVEELVPKVVSIGEIQRVLRQLLRERVPVRDLTTILESMGDVAPITKDPDVMTEAVRAALGRAICRQHQNERGELPTISFAPSLGGATAASRSSAPSRARCSRSTRTKRRISPLESPARSRPQWHSLCFCARQRCDRTSGDCSRECCRRSECSRTTRFQLTCASLPSPFSTDLCI